MATEPQKSKWEKTKTNSKAGFDKVWQSFDKLGGPVNRLSNKLGSEAFWPTSLDKECDKAARILRSFCKDGFYQEEIRPSEEGPKRKQKVVKKIPPEVIKKAKGLAIFTTMRTGLWVSGSGGSGILVGRLPDGSWSPPGGILLHTAGLGFLVGVDIYDCVLVLNTQEALNAFAKLRCTVGGEMSAVAGPVGIGAAIDTEVHKRQSPIFTYLKSRGFYAGVMIDGTIIIERTDENERFYRERISAMDILAGKVRHPPYEVKGLMETLKAAQGDVDVDINMLTDEPAPADFEVEEEGHVFGVPDKEDPDPFGVLALEKEGFAIKEAGSKVVASNEEFDFNPRISSPIYTTYRRSMDSTLSNRQSWRRSTMSSTEKRYTTIDTSTQTDDEVSVKSPRAMPIQMEENDVDSLRSQSPPKKSNGLGNSTSEKHHNENHEDEDGDDDEDEVEIHEVHEAPPRPQILKATVVQVPKRIPPALPPRNPKRASPSPDPSAERDVPEAEATTTLNQIDPLPLTQDSEQEHVSHKTVEKETEHEQEQEQEHHEHDHHGALSPASSEGRPMSFQSVRSEQSSDLDHKIETTTSKIDDVESTPVENKSVENKRLSTATLTTDHIDASPKKDDSDSDSDDDNSLNHPNHREDTLHHDEIPTIQYQHEDQHEDQHDDQHTTPSRPSSPKPLALTESHETTPETRVSLANIRGSMREEFSEDPTPQSEDDDKFSNIRL